MTWVAWRQQRLQIVVSVGLVLIAAAVLVWVHEAAASALAAEGQPGCWATPAGCVGPDVYLVGRFWRFISLYPIVGMALPALLGVFVGAPMFAREAERGTHIFGLTQSVSRTRWWTIKALVGAGPVVLAMTGLGLLNVWALAPLRPAMSVRLMSPMFQSEGLVIGAYTLLGVALGIAAGVWLRNTVAAMAVTLALYIAVLFGLTTQVRPHLLPPLRTTAAFYALVVPEGAWPLRSGLLTTSGEESGQVFPPDCIFTGRGEESVTEDRLQWQLDCLRERGLAGSFAWYQPASRFWPLQLLETGLAALLAVALAGLTAVGVRRRLI
jgi:hypothetical protein